MAAAVQPTSTPYVPENSALDNVDEQVLQAEQESGESLSMPQKSGKSDSPEHAGFLFTQGKYYGLTPKDSDPKKMELFFKEVNPPSTKSEKTSTLEGKKFEIKDPIKEALGQGKTTTSSEKNDTLSKTNSHVTHLLKNDLALLQNFGKLPSPLSLHQTKEKPRPPQTKNEEQKEDKVKSDSSSKNLALRGRNEEIPTPQTRSREEEKKGKEDRQKQDEEGFAENSEQQERESSHSRDEKEKIGEIEEVQQSISKNALEVSNELAKYAHSESVLMSELFKMRITQFDILILFMEVLKLTLKGKEQEKLTRREERRLQIENMQKVSDTLKEQGESQRSASIVAGVTAILGGLCPILGPTKAGEWIHDTIGSVFDSFKNLKQKDFFEKIGGMMMSGSEMQKAIGTFKTTFGDSNRVIFEQQSELHRSDWDENTRSIEELKDYWKNIENFILQSLQMNHETIRQLYSR